MWVVYKGAIASTAVWEVFQKLALLAQNNFAAGFGQAELDHQR